MSFGVASQPEPFESQARVVELLESLLDERARRRLQLRNIPNEEVLARYDREELALRYRNKGAYTWAKTFLGRFVAFLGERHPSSELARAFISQYRDRNASTVYKYASILRGFLTWYGEPFHLRLPVPKTLPPYVPHESVEAVQRAAVQRRTRTNVLRDLLLLDVAYGAGLRRSELTGLMVRDLHLARGFLIVRNGKGGKDRIVYLPDWLTDRLRDYTRGMRPDARLFPISPARVTSILEDLSKRSHVKVKPHDLRHGYATRLVERGVQTVYVQQLLGHERIETTQVYVGFISEQLRRAAHSLDS